jgi:hypothetical protein
VAFYEPDLGGMLTAVALEPAARRLVAHLPLALSPRLRNARVAGTPQWREVKT